jgi:glycosyltransferase involved in cell wall biosynthesis
VKVAFVHDFHGSETPSGENAVVEAEAAALRRAGMEVALIAVHNDDMAKQPLNTLRGAVAVATGIGRSPRRQIEAFAPDVVHVHNLFPYYGRTWLRDLGRPLVVTAHNFRPLCANGYLYRDGHVCTLCPDGQWWSGTRYGCYRDSPLATLPLTIGNLGGVRHDGLYSRADRVLVLSERSLEVYTRAGVDPSRLALHEHFVPDDLRAPPSAVDAARALGLPDRWIVVGRLSEEKGIDRLVAEWPAGVPLDVVGDGPLRARIEAATRGTAIVVHGALPRTDVVRRMAGAAGVVVASRWYETFGLVYIEALSVGVPVVAFEPNVVADAVRRDGTGVVAEWGRVADALAEVAEAGPARRERCLAVFAARYSEEAFVRRRRNLYAELAVTRG